MLSMITIVNVDVGMDENCLRCGGTKREKEVMRSVQRITSKPTEESYDNFAN